MQNGSVQMRLNAPFVDLNHRPQYTRRPAPRSNSRFLGWFHRPRPGGLAPPVCTNLPSLQAEPIVRKKSYVIPTLSLRYLLRYPYVVLLILLTNDWPDTGIRIPFHTNNASTTTTLF